MTKAVLETLHDAAVALTYAADVLEAPSGANMREVMRETVQAWAAVTDLLVALERAEGFISGFEDDETQEGIAEMLAAIRAAIAKAKGIV